MTFPPSVDIDKFGRHPEYAKLAKRWADVEVLYRGEIEEVRDRFLVKRASEPNPTFKSRKEFAGYENLVSQCVNWYGQKLFEDRPRIVQNDLPPSASNSVSEFLNNADRGGETFVQVFSEIATELLLYGVAFLLIENDPSSGEGATSYLEQKQSGALSPYLVRHCPSTVTNWAEDSHGNLTYAMVENEVWIANTDTFPASGKVYRQWIVWTTEEYAVYRAEKDNDATTAHRFAFGRHALAEKKMVPLLRFKARSIGPRMSSPAKSYFNLRAQEDWALATSAIGILAVFSDKEVEGQRGSESTYVRFPKDSRAQFLELSGANLALLHQRAESAHEAVWRAAHLIQQGRSADATPAAASGISKEIDRAPAIEVLKGIGFVIVRGMETILKLVAFIADESENISVSGLEFNEEDLVDCLDVLSRARNLNLQSDTLYRALDAEVAMRLLKDAPEVIRDKVANEIKTGPGRLELLKQQREAAVSQFSKGLMA